MGRNGGIITNRFRVSVLQNEEFWRWMLVMVAQQFTAYLGMVKILYYVYFTTIFKNWAKKWYMPHRVL